MSSERPKDRELEPLWDKLERLKSLESRLPASGPAVSYPASGKLKAEIERRLGFFPPFFLPALEFPDLLETLWRQQLASYYDNPLPQLFKEKLLFRLSQFSTSPYSLVTHACILNRLGMTAREVKEAAQKSPLDSNDLEKAIAAEIKAGKRPPLFSAEQRRALIEGGRAGKGES